MSGSSPVPQLHATSFVVLEIQQQLMGASPCGNIIAPARIDEGSAPSRSKSPVFVSCQRVSPLPSLICMLPERSIKKRTLPAAFCAGYVPVASGQTGVVDASGTVVTGGAPESWLSAGGGGPGT